MLARVSLSMSEGISIDFVLCILIAVHLLGEGPQYNVLTLYCITW